jgi:hypothetical protein
MRDNGHRRQFLLMDQLREVVDIGGHRVAAVGRPLTIAVAAQIGGENVPIMAQGLRDPVPVAAMVAPTVHQQQRWRAGIAPVDIMQPQPLREINARGRPVSLGFAGSALLRRHSYPRSKDDKTPARIIASRGSALRSCPSRPASKPG